MITQEYIQSILEYNQDTGVFVWKYRHDMPKTWNGRFPGKVAGSLRGNSHHMYQVIVINGRAWYAHRLAWIYINGDIDNEIDHIDGNGLNNRISNLRDITRSQNMANSDLVERGVSFYRGYFNARIKYNGKTIHLGAYETKEEAQEVYNIAANNIFGEFARCNRPSTQT